MDCCQGGADKATTCDASSSNVGSTSGLNSCFGSGKGNWKTAQVPAPLPTHMGDSVIGISVS